MVDRWVLRQGVAARPRRLRALACGALLLAVLAISCKQQPFEEPLELGGVTVSAETLNQGFQVYRRNCLACHGQDGDGDGASSSRMKPQPRDFTGGHFKFKSTPDDALPQDADLMRTLRKGLKGTYMNGFDGLSEADAEAVLQYIKTFAPRWREESVPEAIAVPPDPWEGRRQEGMARGELVYHAVAKCWSCHPAFLARVQIESMMEASSETLGEVEWRANLAEPAEVETAYGKQLPTDFSDGTFRAAWTNVDLYRTIGAGVGGTKMPAWAGRLPPDDVWALVHYTRELQRRGEQRRSD